MQEIKSCYLLYDRGYLPKGRAPICFGETRYFPGVGWFVKYYGWDSAQFFVR